MTEPTDFWLQLHRLATAYKSLGATPEIRAAALIPQFQRKSPQAQREAADEMSIMATALANLYSRAGQNG
jgi:hypothetical protein